MAMSLVQSLPDRPCLSNVPPSPSARASTVSRVGTRGSSRQRVASAPAASITRARKAPTRSWLAASEARRLAWKPREALPLLLAVARVPLSLTVKLVAGVKVALA